MCRPMHENEKMEEDRKPVSIDPNEATIMPYFDENNQPPYITKFTYEKNEDELILQKKRDSLFNRSTNNDHIYLESVLILQPKTTRTINFEISQNSDKYNFQILDYYNIGSPGRNMYNRISPVLKDVNPNYYLYKYSFNPSSQLKIKID